MAKETKKTAPKKPTKAKAAEPKKAPEVEKPKEVKKLFYAGVEVLSQEKVVINGNELVKATLANNTTVVDPEDLFNERCE